MKRLLHEVQDGDKSSMLPGPIQDRAKTDQTRFGPGIMVSISQEARAAQKQSKPTRLLSDTISPKQADAAGELFTQLDTLFGPDGDRELSHKEWEKVGAIFDKLDSTLDLTSARSTLGEKQFNHVRALEKELDSIFDNASENEPSKTKKKRAGEIISELMNLWDT